MLRETRESRALALPVTGLLLALVAVLGAVLAGLGTRWEVWNFHAGINLLRWSAYAGLLSGFFSLCCMASSVHRKSRGGAVISVVGVTISSLVVSVPAYYVKEARQLPAIHDITTDTLKPPVFVAILPLRQTASNPPDYGGPQIAQQQKKAYGDIRPLILASPPDEVFNKALFVAQKMNWHIVETNRGEGHIEAVDMTFWFGFKDDIVIRIAPAGNGTRLDVRSASRVGVSDIGTNARRIRKFLNAMNTR